MTDILYRTAESAGDGFDFVISDGSRDRHGTRINPEGWDLSHFNRNPVALFGHSSGFPIGRWENVRVEAGRLLGRLVMAAAGTSQRIDELRNLVEQGILRAVSVGFSVLKEGEPGKSIYDYDEQELQEVSLVSVGSNKNALAMARSLNISESTIELAFGEQARDGKRDVSTGEHAAKPPVSNLKGTSKMETTLSKRIEAAQNELNSARDALTEHLADDNADTTQTEALSSEIEAREERLTSLKRAEKALASRAASDIVEPGRPAAPSVRKPLGVNLREPKPEDLIIRAAVCNVLAHATGSDPIRIMEERYRDHEATQIVVRAAVAGATTTQAGWAAELVETAMGAFMESLRPISVYPRLAALGTSLSFGPGRAAIKLPSRAPTPSISGSFVAESAPIPVRRLGLTSVTLNPHKMGVISVFSREIARLSNPAIEGLLRQEIQSDTALTIDSLLLDAVAGSGTRPAGLTNGVAALTASTAGGYAAILADIQTLAAPFDAANAGRRLVLLMNPAEARILSMTAGPNASGFGWAEQFLSEFTRIVSTTIPAGHVYMIDAADFATAAGDAPEFDVSEQTVLHMEDTTPLQIASTGTPNTVAAPTQSMFQTAQIALRMILDITWAMRRAGMVQHIAAVDWAPPTP
ncbi:HK97 family phage prohead protease/HK97 family phage major capsid protein [Phyllobacterium ifriqiyense]|uniref:HK97 family phage prohead protease/HK97 family phage major capsid protein n=1 Tax=Phyllobacterium ifriqiyense TaxID=314238 RepID=A0ABU0S814_9HYPH|nr:phage major capsid protein [Phyllobacterium ifriqiyense]MDQ0996888.1 HK97 family phage prohead protease/HK97 family phage major capsid protein [Phyllobacterium ifriqiyense]